MVQQGHFVISFKPLTVQSRGGATLPCLTSLLTMPYEAEMAEGSECIPQHFDNKAWQPQHHARASRFDGRYG